MTSLRVQHKLFDDNKNKVGIEITTTGGCPETFLYIIEKRKSVNVWDIIYKGERRDICIHQYFGGTINELQPQPIGDMEEMRARNVFDLYLQRGGKFLKIRTLAFCSKCGRLLTDDKSIKSGLGPECIKEKNYD